MRTQANRTFFGAHGQRALIILWGLGMLLRGAGTNANAAITTKQITYNGWKNCTQVSNGTVEVVVVPQIGRVMRYGYINGSNVLWNNPTLFGKITDLSSASKDWINYGGDKLWPAPQERWGWPPDRALDSGAQTVKVLPDHHVLLTGMVSKALGLQFRREIALDESGTGITFTNTLRNVGKTDVNWSVWQVTQLDDPKEVRLNLNKPGRFPAGYYIFGALPPADNTTHIESEQVVFLRDPKTSGKIGVDSPTGQLEALVHEQKFTASAKFEVGANYPDNGCAQQLYTNPDPLKYVEMELLSPIVTLKPDAGYSFTTRWTLARIEAKQTARNMTPR